MREGGLAVIKLLVTRLRQAWPSVRIIVRGDSGFCRGRSIREFRYQAASWDIGRRVVTRLEFGSQGNNPRLVVTNLELPAAELYDGLSCGREEAENRIKETQPDLSGTELARATSATIRVRLLKMGAAIVRNTRRILLSSHHPLREVYFIAANALSSPQPLPSASPTC